MTHFAGFSFIYDLCSLGESDWENVRLQEAREEADKKAKRRIHGAYWEANPAENKLEICGKSGLRLWNERRSMSRPNHHERYEIKLIFCEEFSFWCLHS